MLYLRQLTSARSERGNVLEAAVAALAVAT